jgi:hypothetical protein
LELLNLSVLEWLHAGGWLPMAASNQARLLAPQLRQWLAAYQGEKLFEGLLELATVLAERLVPSGPTPAAFRSAFAHVFLAQVLEAVAMEAHTAGRHEVFVELRPFLHNDPGGSELAHLKMSLQLSDTAIGLALTSLRRRFLERIDAGLTLWAATPESRNALRRQLRECLIGTESTP